MSDVKQVTLFHEFKEIWMYITLHYFILPSPQSQSYEPKVLVHAAFSGQSFHDVRHSSRSPQEPTVPLIPKNPVLQLQEKDPPLNNGSKMTKKPLKSYGAVLPGAPWEPGNRYLKPSYWCMLHFHHNCELQWYIRQHQHKLQKHQPQTRFHMLKYF